MQRKFQPSTNISSNHKNGQIRAVLWLVELYVSLVVEFHWFSLSTLIFGQKSWFLGPTIVTKILQSIWWIMYVLRRLEFSIRKSRHKIINLVIWCDFKHVWTPLCGATPSQQPEKILSFFINIVPGMNESWSCNELLFTFFCSSWFMSPGPVVNLGLKLFPARRFLIWV